MAAVPLFDEHRFVAEAVRMKISESIDFSSRRRAKVSSALFHISVTNCERLELAHIANASKIIAKKFVVGLIFYQIIR